jgi:hypothetical protein
MAEKPSHLHGSGQTTNRKHGRDGLIRGNFG